MLHRSPLVACGLSLGLSLMSALAFATSAAAQAPCDHHAAPTAAGDPAGGPPGRADAPGTRAAPFTVEQFWLRGHARPGRTLCLAPGTYRGRASMLRPPANRSGKPGAWITVRALEDGSVLFDGEGERAPVALTRVRYWHLAGFDAANGTRSVVGIDGSETRPAAHLILERIVAWNADPSGNSKVFDIGPFVEHTLLEDVGGFGPARKVFSVYRSRRVTLRRAWARWGGWSMPGRETLRNTMAFSCLYRSYDVICENLIATSTGEGNPIAIDHVRPEDDSPRPDPYDSGLRILGSLAMVETGIAAPPGAAVRIKNVKNVRVADLVSWVANGDTLALNIKDCEDRCRWVPARDRGSLVMDGVTEIGGRPPKPISHWSQRERMRVASPEHVVDVFSDPPGASLCHRYVDGERTDQPLWPWPMEERIRAATQRAGGPVVRVTATVEARLGPIPPACRSAQTAPGSGTTPANAAPGRPTLLPTH